MALTITVEEIPLEIDMDGVVRVGKTRVTLDTVVGAFQDGATAEEIVQSYTSLKLADVSIAIGFYLRRQAEVDEYLRERQAHTEEVRKGNEARLNHDGLRDRLMARRERAPWNSQKV